MTGEGETFVAGILAGLPALAAVGALSAASYQRFQPSHRVGAPACPGHENREAAPRFITGMTGSGPGRPTSRSSASTRPPTPIW